MKTWWKCNCGAPLLDVYSDDCCASCGNRCSRHGKVLWKYQGKYPVNYLIVTDEKPL